MSEKEKVEGYVEHIIFRNEENGYTVLNLSMKGRELTCVGTLPMIGEGELIEASGDYIEHAAYGKQFRIESYETKVPQDSVALERYLGSGAIKGVGAALAARIVRRFGDDTLRIIEEEPERLAEVKGISERKAREIAQQVAEKAEMQNAMIFLSGYGIALNLGAKIYQQYGDNVYRILKENPYKMAEDIAGVGFRTADEIAGKIRIAVDSEFRIKSGLSYVLNQATAEGHVYLPEPVLLRRGQELLGVEPERMQKSLQDMAIDKKAVIRELPAEREGDEPLRIVYASQYYYLELSTARMLHELNITCEEDREAIEKRIGKIEKKYQIELDEMQKTAVVEAAYSGLMILTGGPGTGKTFIASGLVHEAVKEGYNAALISLEDLLVCLKTKDVSRHAMKTYERIMKARLLAIDNVTLYPLKREDMLLLFKLVNTLQEKVSLIIIANRGLAEWLEELGDEAVAAALLDRLLYCCEVINLSGKSYRLENRKTIFSNRSEDTDTLKELTTVK